MHLNIAHKIFGVAVAVLIFMAAVAGLSVWLTKQISDELDLVANKQLPLSDTIGQINTRILEQGILLQRLFGMTHEKPAALKRVDQLGDELNADFKRAFELFKLEEGDDEAPPTVFQLHKALQAVEKEYRGYERQALHLLKLHATGDQISFEAKLPDFNRLQNAVDKEVSSLRQHVERVSDEAVKRADVAEKFLLVMNASLTVVAAILGLGLAAIITFVLVRNIRNLVKASEEVESGRLDVEVPVITHDEVGRLAASFNGMVDGLRMKERIKDTFGKYMDPRIVARLVENPEFTKLGGERREMTVMFIDLQGYTSISERLSADDLVRMLNMFFGQMTDAIAANQGVVNDFPCDAVMAYWGPPFTGPDEHAALACGTAQDAFRNFEKFRTQVATELGPVAAGLELGMRIGISSGEMVSGNIGSAESRKFSVIGDPVNLGSRLESANKNYGTGTIMSERTRELAGSAVHAREIDRIRVKGKSEPTRIFELLDTAPSAGSFADGLAAYRRQDWADAEAAFRRCRDTAPKDPVPGVFLQRIEFLKQNPPGTAWDGVWEFQTK